MIALAIAVLSAQQVGKFEGRDPAFVVSSQKSLEDIERCMIRFGSPPIVYRQPDRPDASTIVWVAGSLSAGNAAGRVDLRRTASGTEIKSWLNVREIRDCA